MQSRTKCNLVFDKGVSLSLHSLVADTCSVGKIPSRLRKEIKSCYAFDFLY